jgi:hypothetical protein
MRFLAKGGRVILLLALILPLKAGHGVAQDDPGIPSSIFNTMVQQSLDHNQAGPTAQQLTTTLANSGLGSVGVLNVGQVAGIWNNQAVLLSMPLGIAGTNNPVQVVLNYQGDVKNNTLNLIPGSNYQASISGSFRSFTGLAGVNQVVGNLNNSLTSTSLTLGTAPDPGPATALVKILSGGFEASLTNAQLSAIATNVANTGTFNSPPNLPVANVKIDPSSFQNSIGVANVCQTAGNLNTALSSLNINVKTVP